MPKKTTDKQRGNNGNLKPWKKGQSGNPKGRPKKGSTWSEVANQLLDAQALDIRLTLPNGKKHEITCSIEDGNTIRHAVVGALVVEALKGNIPAIRELADRTEGKPAQKLEVEQNILPTGFDIGLIKN